MSSETWDKEAAQSLLDNVDLKITDEQKDLCDTPISIKEIKKEIHSLKKDKSPGLDGIPAGNLDENFF